MRGAAVSNRGYRRIRRSGCHATARTLERAGRRGRPHRRKSAARLTAGARAHRGYAGAFRLPPGDECGSSHSWRSQILIRTVEVNCRPRPPRESSDHAGSPNPAPQYCKYRESLPAGEFSYLLNPPAPGLRSARYRLPTTLLFRSTLDPAAIIVVEIRGRRPVSVTTSCT